MKPFFLFKYISGQDASSTSVKPVVRQRETMLEVDLQSVHRRVFRRIVSQTLRRRVAHLRFSIGNIQYYMDRYFVLIDFRSYMYMRLYTILTNNRYI